MPSQPQDNKPSKKKQVARKKPVEPSEANDPSTEPPEGDDAISGQFSSEADLPDAHTDHSRYPETLASLAVQLLQPELPNMRDIGRRLSGESFDGIYYDALVRADSLLRLAAGLADEEVHVYQLFKENSAPLSFESIAKRFEEVAVRPHKGLPTSKNTVEVRVEEILSAARQHISDALDDENADLSLAMGVPVDEVTLRKRISRQMESMIRRTRLVRVVRDPKSFSDEISRYFIKRLGEEINRGQLWFAEYSRSSYGEYEFIEHVCDGLSYEDFIQKNHLGINLSPDETNAILFYLRQLGEGMMGRPENRDEIKKLTSLFVGSADALQPVVQQLTECGEKLDLEDPDLDGAKRCALQASRSLELVTDHWLFLRFWRMLPVLDVKSELVQLVKTLSDGRTVNCDTDGHSLPSTLEYVRSFIEVLDEANELAKTDATPVERAKYLKLLMEISDGARFIRMSENPHARPVLSDELTWHLEKIATAADDGIDLEPVSAREQWRRVDEILKAEKKLIASRKVKAYELFLFAAQAGIMPDRLVIRRSDLKPSCEVSCRHDLRETVLFSKRGNCRTDVD